MLRMAGTVERRGSRLHTRACIVRGVVGGIRHEDQRNNRIPGGSRRLSNGQRGLYSTEADKPAAPTTSPLCASRCIRDPQHH
jgi:hypothetical protein